MKLQLQRASAPPGLGTTHRARCTGANSASIRPAFLPRRWDHFPLPSLRLKGRCTSQTSRASLPSSGSQSAALDSPQEQQQFHWSSAVSQDPEAGVEEAVAEVVRQALASWPAGSKPQLAFVFVSSSYQRRYEMVLPLLLYKVPSLRHVLGCSGYGVLGMRQGAPEEWEGQPAFSLTLASLPGVSMSSFHVPPSALPDADAAPQAWYSLTGVSPSEEGHTNFILLSDAAFGGVMDLLAGLDYAYPTARKAGGLNSSVSANARRAMWQWSRDADPDVASTGLRDAGCVGLALQGPLLMDTLVAQGCRPLGEGVFSVKRAHNSLVLEVEPEGGGGGGRVRGGVTPLTLLQEELTKLGPEDRDRAARNLMVGLAPDDFKAAGELGPGDFLVRGLMGADPGSGAVMVGDTVRVGQRLQFLVRDREGAMHDLVSHGVAEKKRELIASLAGTPLPSPLGCLIFTCNGRGRGLYREPHYDSRTLAEYIPAPSAGFFCNGEIGQVGTATYLHGFTCAAAIFRPVLARDTADSQQEAQQAQQAQQQQQEE